ncbi:MAG TPA: enoyl-CoA hydratase/isomerase family protein [Polyangiaceae bacterium]|nr:enoyl-CoA hydratase/isomerase family protein [Polyangiaceae bacterium]HMR74644.1 enoyl-CoA hydratase/isomerase family protein [Polyangiaceae bacterium]
MTVHVRANSPIAEVVLDRPKVNAFDVDQVERLSAGFEQLAAVDGLRAVLLCAARDVAFSAGADLGATGPLAEPTGLERWTNAARAMLDRIADFPVPVVASLRKPAAGGGFELALACHFRVLATDAHLSLPEIDRGYLPSWSAAERLLPLIGPARTLDLLLSGRRVHAAEALSVGLVHRVADDADAEAQQLCEHIAAKPPLAVAAALEQVRLAARQDHATLRARELADLERLVRTEDTVEGVMSFFEKRAPAFKGR